MLKLLSHWTPRPTPDTADTMNAPVSTAMITAESVVDEFTPQTKFSPR